MKSYIVNSMKSMIRCYLFIIINIIIIKIRLLAKGS